MKIVQVCPYAMGRPGGVQTHVRDLSNWLRAQGHKVTVIAPDDGHTEDGLYPLGGFRQMSLHGTQFEVARANRRELRQCSQAMHKWGADMVHLHTPWTPMLAWQVWRALRLPSVGTFHATLPEAAGFDPFASFLRGAAGYFSKRLQGISVPSEAPQSQWVANGFPAPNIIAPAINLSTWRGAGRSEAPGMSLVYLGRLEDRKGLHVLLDAWSLVAPMMPSAHLTIAGGGPIEGTLRARIQAENLSNVTMRPPPSNADAQNLVASADFFVAPALDGESFGLVLIEAMAAGTLPIAAANAGFSTVMTGEGRALLTPPGDSNALAEKILLLATNPTMRHPLQRWADARAANFDITMVGPKVEALYHMAQQ